MDKSAPSLSLCSKAIDTLNASLFQKAIDTSVMTCLSPNHAPTLPNNSHLSINPSFDHHHNPSPTTRSLRPPLINTSTVFINTYTTPQYFSLTLPVMDPDKEIHFEFFPVIRVYKSGRVERFHTQNVPASTDPATGVTSKDVVIDSSTGLWVRLYLPKLENPSEHKLPVVVYYHGGAFMIGSAADPFSHNFLNSVVAEAKIVAVSVNYRLAPEFPLPIGYDDCTAAFKWVISHANGSGPEPWLVDYADFGCVFLAGCSAGGNMAHTVALRAGLDKLEPGLVVKGMVLVHPYFWGKERIKSEVGLSDAEWAKTEEVWHFVYPSTSGLDDPVSNPFVEGAPSVKNLVCKRVLVCVAEHDALRDRGVWYCEKLKESEWDGEAELLESVGEGHAFHVMKPTCEKSDELMERIIAFLNK